MATPTADRSTGKITLTGTSIDTVSLHTGGPFEVCNWTGTADLTVTFGYTSPQGPTVVAADPVAGAAGTYTVPPGFARRLLAPSDASNDLTVVELTVKVLGNGNVYSVDGGF